MFDGIWQPEDAPRQQQQEPKPIVSHLGTVIAEQFQCIDKMDNEDICYILDKILEDEFDEEIPNKEDAMAFVEQHKKTLKDDSNENDSRDENMTLDELNGKIKKSLDFILAYAAIEKRFRDPEIIKKQLKRFLFGNEIKAKIEKDKILRKSRRHKAECKGIKNKSHFDQEEPVPERKNKFKLIKFIKEPPESCDFERESSEDILLLNRILSTESSKHDSALISWMKAVMVKFSKAMPGVHKIMATKATATNMGKEYLMSRTTAYTTLPMSKSAAKGPISTPDKENDKSTTTGSNANIPPCSDMVTEIILMPPISATRPSSKRTTKECSTNKTTQTPTTDGDEGLAEVIWQRMPTDKDELTPPVRTMVWTRTSARTSNDLGNSMIKGFGRFPPMLKAPTGNRIKILPDANTPIHGFKVTPLDAPPGITTDKPSMLRDEPMKKDPNLTKGMLEEASKLSAEGISTATFTIGNESRCNDTCTALHKVTDMKLLLTTTMPDGATKAMHSILKKGGTKAMEDSPDKCSTKATENTSTMSQGVIKNKETTTGYNFTTVKTRKHKTVTITEPTCITLTNDLTKVPAVNWAGNMPITQTQIGHNSHKKLNAERIAREFRQKEFNSKVLKKSSVSTQLNYPEMGFTPAYLRPDPPHEVKQTATLNNKPKPKLLASFLPIEDDGFEVNPPAKDKYVKRPPRKAYGRLCTEADDTDSLKYKIDDPFADDRRDKFELVTAGEDHNACNASEAPTMKAITKAVGKLEAMPCTKTDCQGNFMVASDLCDLNMCAALTATKKTEAEAKTEGHVNSRNTNGNINANAGSLFKPTIATTTTTMKMEMAMLQQKELNENSINRLHAMPMSDDDDEDDDYDESLTCNVCDRRFQCHRQLASHQQKKRHFCCSYCDSFFQTQMILEHHKEEFEHWTEYELSRRLCCRRNRDDYFTDTDSYTSEAESEDMERLL